MFFGNITLWRPKYFDSPEFQRSWQQFQRQWWRLVRDYNLDSNAVVYGTIGTLVTLVVGVASLFAYQEWRIRRALRDINWQIGAQQISNVSTNTGKKQQKKASTAGKQKKTSNNSNTTAASSTVRQRKNVKINAARQDFASADVVDRHKAASHANFMNTDSAKIMESLRMFCPYIPGENNNSDHKLSVDNTSSLGGGRGAENDDDDNDESIRRSSMFEELVEEEIAEREENGKAGITLFDDVEKPVDPVDIAMHLPGQVKRIQNKLQTREIEKELNEQQMRDERDARRNQLEAIFKLMQDQQEKFGEQSLEDLNSQLHLYAL